MKKSLQRSQKSPNRWIANALKKTKKGSFSAEAARAGMSTQAFACQVLRSKKNTITRKRAQMYVNMNKSRRC